MEEKKGKGLLIVLSGPSGAGKGTIYGEVVKRLPQLKQSISVTTRAPRPGEIEGVHYYFRSVEEYERMKANNEFLETATVYNNRYGTPKAPVFRMIDEGDDVFFEIDVEGAKQVKQKYPDCVSVFIMPPSFAVLERRLRGRGTESEDSLRTRLGCARSELAQYELFDYIVFNDDAEEATCRVIDIIKAEKSRVKNNEHTIQALLNE